MTKREIGLIQAELADGLEELAVCITERTVIMLEDVKDLEEIRHMIVVDKDEDDPVASFEAWLNTKQERSHKMEVNSLRKHEIEAKCKRLLVEYMYAKLRGGK